MLDVKQAAQKASEYFNALYAEHSLSTVQLEEVELTEDGEYWLITLSYPTSRDTASGLTELFGRTGPKEYKVFKIDAKTGEVKSMKIRKVE
jgi:hypothetical protein